MRPFQAQPEYVRNTFPARSKALMVVTTPHRLQPAFVLNLDSHWFTLRRFGPVSLDFHWFNLNSLSKKPEFVSNTLLGMTLQQAETEGYSVFVVRPLDDDGTSTANPLPETTVDILAGTIPRIPSYTSPAVGSPATRNVLGRDQPPVNQSPLNENFGFEDEDLELQRALQASLAEGGYAEPVPAIASDPVRGSALDLPDEAFAAFQASMARQRETLAHARREQEEAIRESLQNEISSGSARRRQTAGEEEEEEMMRRALEESMATVKGSTPVVEGDDDVEFVDAETSPPATPLRSALRNLPPPEHFGGPRMLDDEDAELQAALRASLETVPEGFTVPRTPPPVRIGSRMQLVEETLAPARGGTTVQPPGESVTSAPPSPVASIDVDEMRRRRLERFNK
ncbi:hypothetical protein FRB95_011489 [Tulasnella sp. JGI-2019a]|nr:hypothetical protein FRB93_012920 [Tulasnella sp. JGI-2019a]KAG9035338.1 hypothetical protein FRB95_011489 [Tulasnella sp. JGI-2019a]